MLNLKVVQTQKGLAILLTDEAAAALRVVDGDVLFARVAATGAVSLFGPDPKVTEEVRLGEEFMNDYRGTFHRLAD